MPKPRVGREEGEDMEARRQAPSAPTVTRKAPGHSGCSASCGRSRAQLQPQPLPPTPRPPDALSREKNVCSIIVVCRGSRSGRIA